MPGAVIVNRYLRVVQRHDAPGVPTYKWIDIYDSYDKDEAIRQLEIEEDAHPPRRVRRGARWVKAPVFRVVTRRERL